MGSDNEARHYYIAKLVAHQRGLLLDLLNDLARDGAGGRALNITFSTEHPDCRLPEYIRQRYPSNMTIVLEHTFQDLEVLDDAFEVSLRFGGVWEHLHVPCAAVQVIHDRQADFLMPFIEIMMAREGDSGKPGLKSARKSDKETIGPRGTQNPRSSHKPVAQQKQVPEADDGTAPTQQPGSAPVPAKHSGVDSGGNVIKVDFSKKKE